MSRRLIITLFAAAVAVILYALLSSCQLNFGSLKVCAHTLHAQAQEHYILAVLAFSAFYIISIALSMPWAALMTLTGGYLFGMISVLYVVISGSIGAVIAFLLSRYVVGEYMQRMWGRYVAKFNQEIDEHGGMYLLVIRLIPVIPFCAVNALAGLTTISVRSYIASTVVGMIPSTIIFTYAGTKLAHLSRVWDIFSWQIILIFGLLITLGLLALVIKRVFKF